MSATEPVTRSAADAIGLRWMAAGPALGPALGAVDSIVIHVPVWPGEVGTGRGR